MANITISELRPAGADLFSDSESYLTDLTGSETLGTLGGAGSISICWENDKTLIRSITICWGSSLLGKDTKDTKIDRFYGKLNLSHRT